MKLTIALFCSVFVLGGCIESSDSSKQVNQQEIKQDEQEIDNPDRLVTFEPEPPVTPEQAAVSDMLINTEPGSLQFDYWFCSDEGDDDTVSFLFAEDGTGRFNNSGRIIGSNSDSDITWNENTPGTIEVNLPEFDVIFEWRNFNFISLFEFTADAYQNGELQAQSRCKLDEIFVTPPQENDDINAGFFVTAPSYQGDDDLQYIWSCVIDSERLVFSFFADQTGFVFYNDDGEASGFELSNWDVSGDSLQTYLSDGSQDIPYIRFDSITVDDNSFRVGNSFEIGDLVIDNDSFGEATCELVDTQV